jgi:hypothetical protein
MIKLHITAYLYVVVLLLCHGAANAQWEVNPAINTAVSTVGNNKIEPVIVGDGTGGSIIAWREYSVTTGYDIMTQRLDTLGFPQWPLPGVAICTTVNDVFEIQIAPDHQGGALLVWRDYRSGSSWDIYAQRVDSSGVTQWTGDGVPVCTATGHQLDPKVVGDGAGGAILVWRDIRNGMDYDIYAQRIDASGSVKWTGDGIPVSSLAGYQGDPQIVSDGSGGAVIVWEDFRSGTNHDIYAQRVDSSGTAAWIPNGNVISFAANDQINPRAVSDSLGRTIIAWEDARSGFSWDIYAQRINNSGALVWNPVAESICTAPLSQGNIWLANDGSGGAIITWQDDRTGLNTDIYAQKVDHFGGLKWGLDGVPVVTATNHQQSPRVIDDGYGGGIITWHDLRNGTDYNIYAQRIDVAGAVQWDADGVEIGTASGNQLRPSIISDGAHGAIITFEDSRTLSYNDIYAQNLVEDGTLGILPFVTATAGPNGSVDPGGITPVFWGGNLHVDVNPDTGYHVDSVFINGVYAGASTGYDFTNVTINYTIHAQFAINIYTINATAGPNGDMTPSGVIPVPHGFGQAFNFSADSGYQIGLVIVDGVEIGTPGSHFFPAVSTDHDIGVYFRNDSTTINYVKGNWNLVSVPSLVGDYTKTSLFPSATSDAFGFDGSYQTESVLENEAGYWMKFAAPEVVYLYGTPLMTDTFNVAEGWNMIGSISEEVPVANITSDPPGIVTSQFYGYAKGYAISSSIVPSKGYWVKADQSGQLVLSSSPSQVPGNRIKIVPTEELPPAPPDHTVTEIIRTIPEKFVLHQNYPNPFNPTTVIRYDLPAAHEVTVAIYNTIGERVALLSEGFREPGSHEVYWSAAGFPTGVYFYQFRAGPYSDIRKMVLVK